MSKLKNAFRKVGSMLNNREETPKQKLTPDEVELMAHKRREHLDNVKKELYRYRKRNSMLVNKNWTKEFGEKNKPLLNDKYVFKDKKTKQRRILTRGKRRKGGSSLW